MNKKSVKKALLLVLCAILLVVASVMGTLAYLTSSDEVTNTFTVGNVTITMDEAKTNTAGKTVDAGNNEVALVDAPRVKENTYHLIPGSTYSKDPTVHIGTTSESCYVFIVVENNLGANEGANAQGKKIADQIAGNAWTEYQTNVYYKVWDATSDAADKDLEIFSEFTVAPTATNGSLAAINGEEIVINAYAVQRQNVADEDAAWAAIGAAYPGA